MKKFVVKSISIVLTVILLTSVILPFSVYSEENTSPIMPRWSIIYIMDMDIVFYAEGKGIVSAAATGQSNAILMEGRVRLFEYVNNAWVLIGDYSNSVSNGSVVVEGYFDTVNGRDYKAYFYVTAHSADDVERTYCKVEETCPNP